MFYSCCKHCVFPTLPTTHLTDELSMVLRFMDLLCRLPLELTEEVGTEKCLSVSRIGGEKEMG